MSAPTKIPLSSLPRGELEALAERLLAENDALKQAVAELKAEVATLKGVKGRPEVKPSGMEKAPAPIRVPRTGDAVAGARLTGSPSTRSASSRRTSPPARGSRATRTSSSRTWCSARTSYASAASAG